MDLKEIRKLIIGKWKFDDGRIIEFINSDEYILRNSLDVPFNNDKPHRIFYQKSKDDTGRIIISMPLLLEPLAVITLLSDYQFIYDSCDIDGSKTKRELIRINN